MCYSKTEHRRYAAAPIIFAKILSGAAARTADRIEGHRHLFTGIKDGKRSVMSDAGKAVIKEFFPDRDPEEVWSILEPTLTKFDATWSRRGSIELDIRECRLWYWIGYLAATDTLKLSE